MPKLPHQIGATIAKDATPSANEEKPVGNFIFEGASTSTPAMSDAYQGAPSKPRRVATPGPALSYEEAKARLFQNFDEALHELAK